MKHQNPTILIADDNEDDRLLIEHSFKNVKAPYRIRLVCDGEDAIQYMMGEGKYADRTEYPYPSFIITDLKMPRKDGLDVLEFLKKNPDWAIIPTVVFSGSANDDDIKKAYMLGASSYHVKPSTREGLKLQIQALDTYWRTCEVPETDSTGRRLRTDSNGTIGERYPQFEGDPLAR
jgi:CheY-like chemotaxis protein